MPVPPISSSRSSASEADADVDADEQKNDGDDDVQAVRRDLRVAAELGRSLLRRAELAERQLAELELARDQRVAHLDDELVRAAHQQGDLRCELARTTERLSACEGAKLRLDAELRAASAHAERRHQLELGEALDALRSEKEVAEREACEWRRRAAEYEARGDRLRRELEDAERRCDAALADAGALRESIRKGSIHQKLLQLDKQNSCEESEALQKRTKRLEKDNERKKAENSRLSRVLQALELSQNSFSPTTVLPSRPSPHSFRSFPSLFDELEGDDSSQGAARRQAAGADVIVEFFHMTAMSKKLKMIEEGQTHVLAISNDELYEAVRRSSIPFHHFDDWLTERLELAVELRPHSLAPAPARGSKRRQRAFSLWKWL